MGRLRSGRVKRTPLTGVTSDRYKFLGLEQAEPTFGDPLVGPSSVGSNPIPVGQVYQVVSVSNSEGKRYWTPLVGFGTTVGVISVYENGFLPNGDNKFQKIHGLNFVGTGVTIETPPIDGPFEGVGIATIRISVNEISNQGNVSEILYNTSSGLANGANEFVYNDVTNFVGIGTTNPTEKLEVLGNVKVSGVITASQFFGNVTGTTVTTNDVIGGIGSFNQLKVSGVSSLSNVSSTGVITATKFSGPLEGVAQKSTNLDGGQSGEIPYQIGPGITTFVPTTGATNKFLKYDGTSPIWSNIAEIGGEFTNIDVKDTVLSKTQYLTFSSSIGSTNSLNLNSGKLVFNSDSSKLGIGTTTPSNELDVIGNIKASETIISKNLNVSGVSTLGNVQITSGIVTAAIGIITYYGDGQYLQNINTVGLLTAKDVIGGIASITSLNVSGISTFNNTIIINGGVSAGSTIGVLGQYLISTGSGVSWATLPSARTVDTQIAGAGQTFFTTSYVVGLLDVFVNGIRLSDQDYIANNSTDVTISFPSFGGEVVDFVSYSTVTPGTVNYGGNSQWSTVASGIITSSNVGIGTTNPRHKLHVVGSGGTTLLVEGDVRITGILSIGTNTITLDPTNNNVSIGTAITLNANEGTIEVQGSTFINSSGNANYSGIVTAFKFVGDGSELTNVGAALSVSVRTGVGGTNSSEVSNVKAIRFNSPSFTVTDLGDGEVFVNSESTFKTWYVSGQPTLVASGDDYVELIAGAGIAITTRNTASGVGTGEVKSVTITSTGGGGGESYWVSNVAGIHTTSNVGIGTTNPQTKLEVHGVLGFNNSNVRIGDNTTGASLTSGDNNILMGVGAGSSLVGGNHNFFAGLTAGQCTLNSQWNTFIGNSAGQCNVSGSANVFIGGWGPGNSNITGQYNVFFSGYSGDRNTTGSFNNFFGGYSGCFNTIGSYNNFFGYCSGYSNTTGNNNVFLGSNSGLSTSSSYKVILGSGATYDQLFDSPNTTKDTQLAIGIRTDANPANYWIVGNENFNVGIGTTDPTSKLTVGGEVIADRYLSPSNNVFLGTCSGHLATGFGYNHFFGYYAGAYSSESSTTAIGCYANYCGSGYDNNFLGYCAGAYASVSYSNAIGYCAGYYASGGCNNFFGCYAGACNTGCLNTFVGECSGSGNTGNFNFSGGYRAGRQNTGNNNNFLGSDAGNYGSGSCNNFIGYCAGTTSSGSYNNFFGYYSGRSNCGNYNNFFGYCAGYDMSSTNLGSYNNFFGYRSGHQNTTGYSNIFIGELSGESNTTGIHNVAIGKFSADYNTTGSCNIFLGYGAGCGNVNGSNNTFLGTYAGWNTLSGEYNNFLGYYSGNSNTTGSYNNFLGYKVGLSTSASNKIIIGRGSSTYPNYFDSPDTTKDTQLAIGIRTDANPANYWIVGNENFNVGIGTTNPTSKLTVTGDVNVSGSINATNGFISVGNTTPIQINLVGNQLTFTAVGIGSTTFTLF